MHVVKPNTISVGWSLHVNEKCIPDKHHKDKHPLVSTLIQPSELEVHRQVTLPDTKIVPNTKIALKNLPKKFYSVISKTSNDIGQIDLIEMHIATRPDATPIAACPSSLALKHHDFLKQEIQNLFNVGIIHKSMSPWASPIEVVKKHTLKAHPNNFNCVSIIENSTHYYQLSPQQQETRMAQWPSCLYQR